MKCALSCLALCFVVLFAGCSQDHYEIEITPTEDGFERKVTCWSERVSEDEHGNETVHIMQLDDEKLTALKKIYGDRLPDTPEGKQKFAARFKNNMPQDLGGAGSLTRFRSPMGEAVVYIERFRGEDDLHASINNRLNVVDEIVDITLGWLEKEVGDTTDFAKLKRFADEDLRLDLKNVVLHAWIDDVAAQNDESAQAEFTFRMLQYFTQRGYVTVEDLPMLARAEGSVTADEVIDLVKLIIARKMGVADGKPMPDCLKLFDDLEHLEVSLDEHVKDTDLYKRRLKKWNAENPDLPEDEMYRPTDAITEVVIEDVFNIQIMEPVDDLTVRLVTGEEPVETNGEWDDKSGKVTFTESLSASRSLPAFAYAMWATPNEEAQKPPFGKTLLTGGNLVEYVIWYEGLTEEEQELWNEFIAGCTPKKKALIERVREFRFPHDPDEWPNPEFADPEMEPPSIADPAKAAILDALGIDFYDSGQPGLAPPPPPGVGPVPPAPEPPAPLPLPPAPVVDPEA